MSRDPGDESVYVHMPVGRDGPMIHRVLSEAGIAVRLFATLGELCDGIEHFPGCAIVAEEALTADALPRLIESLGRQPVWSDLPLIVLTGGGSTTRFSERVALDLQPVGNVTMLERPLRIITLVSAVRSALRARRRQHEVRDLLSQTQEQVRQRDRFLALLGHELRNPLAAIRTSIEVLKESDGERDGAPRADGDGRADGHGRLDGDGRAGRDGRADGDGRAQSVEQREIIVRQSAHLARLVDDLLDVARITADKITLDKRPVNLADVVRHSIATLRLAFPSLTQQIAFHCSEDRGVWVDGDPIRLEQIVTNLVGNSIKYTRDGGRVSVKLDCEDGLARIVVDDDGIGIPRDMLPRIFQPFVRVDPSSAQAPSGLGLGLAVVRGLVELHGGQISAHSEGDGRGATFTLHLPMVPKPAVRPKLAPDIDGPRPSRSVLVIEDGEDARRAMLALLKLWGHRTHAAADGPSGVRRAVEAKPDVALVDIGLPGFDGYEVARQIRALMGDAVHLVALTGYGLAEDRRKAIEAGFDRHLAKPVDPRVLAEVLNAPLDGAGAPFGV